jgi:uncharacterized membrane protein
MAKKNILLIGESFTETIRHTKGFDVIELGGYQDFSGYFTDNMVDFKDLNITHIPNHLVPSKYPRTMEEISKFDTVIISDCGRNTLTMYPYNEMFKVPIGTNKLQLTADYVRNGGSLIMPGGWFVFQGFEGRGNYHGTPIEEVLPVKIMATDDRIEDTEGVKPKIIKKDHPILKGISTDWPKFLGYQRVVARDDAEVLATIGKDELPFIIVGKAGKGRSMAMTSDLAPHWGADFVIWKDYGKFWNNVINWLTE